MTRSPHFRRFAPIFALLVLLTAALPAWSGSCGSNSRPDIVDTAVSAGSFETLVAAVQAAGLVETLKGDGPFTVFAPTDDAFAALPEGVVASLLEPRNKQKLVEILTYHVAGGRLTAEEVVNRRSIETLNGQRAPIDIDNGVRIGAANITATDVLADNGVIHVIDAVLLPPGFNAAALMPAGNEATELIRLAIDRGVPLYNNNQPEACRAVYEVTARSLVSGNYDLSRRAMDRLEHALAEVADEHDAREQAWILRYALDDALEDAMAPSMHASRR